MAGTTKFHFFNHSVNTIDRQAFKIKIQNTWILPSILPYSLFLLGFSQLCCSKRIFSAYFLNTWSLLIKCKARVKSNPHHHTTNKYQLCPLISSLTCTRRPKLLSSRIGIYFARSILLTSYKKTLVLLWPKYYKN